MKRSRGQSLGGRYRSQPRDPLTGRRLNIAGRTLSEIENRLARVDHVRDGLRYGDISAIEAQGKLRPAVGMKLAVAELVERFIRGVPEQSEKPARSAWKNLLEPWFGEALVWDLTAGKMRAWKTDLERARRPRGKKGYAPKYIAYSWEVLKGSVRLAVKDGLLSELPWGEFYVRTPKRPQKEREVARDPVEMLKILAVARQWDEDEGRSAGRFVLLVVLFLSGMRQAEAAGLSWSDVDFDRGLLLIRRQARRGWRRAGLEKPDQKPKGGPAPHVLHPDVERALRYQRHALEAAGRFRLDGPVFPRPGTSLFRTAGIVMTPRAFREIVRRAGLPNVDDWTVHSTRHSFSRLELLGHGGDLTTVAGRTRHADLEVLQGYFPAKTRARLGGLEDPRAPARARGSGARGRAP